MGGAQPFVGRSRELEQVHEAIARRVRLIVIEGSAGMGKSRLLQEVTQALPDQHVPLSGTAFAYDDRPFGALGDALADYLAESDLNDDALGGLGDVIDAIRRDRAGPTDHCAVTPRDVAQAIVELLSRTSRDRHAVLMIDDGHLVDADVTGVIDRIVRSAAPCTTIIATRPAHEQDHHVLRLVDDISRASSFERVELVPWSVEDVVEFLHRALGFEATGLALAVHDRTHGHPLLISHLVESGVLGGSDETLPIPESLRESTRRVLVGLTNDSRLVVDAAAVLAPRAAFDHLALATDLGESHLLAALRQLCDARLLVESAPDEFDFTHALVHEAITDAMLARDRRRLHSIALEMLPAGADPLRIVHHARHAGTPWVAVPAARTAAGRALDDGCPGRAFGVASEAFAVAPADVELARLVATSAWQVRRPEVALDAARHGIALCTPSDTAVLACLYWVLARASFDTGTAGDVDAAIDAMIGLLPDLAEPDRVVTLHRIAETTMLAARTDAVHWAQLAYEAAGVEPHDQIPALINLGSALSYMHDRRAEGMTLLDRAIELARVSGSDLDLARALNNRACDAIHVDSYGDALALLDDFESHVRTRGLVVFLEHVVLWRGLLAQQVGDLAAVRRALQWSGPADSGYGGSMRWFASSIALRTGQYDECAALLRGSDKAPIMWGATWHRLLSIEHTVLTSAANADSECQRLYEFAAQSPRNDLWFVDQVGHAAVTLARATPAVSGCVAAAWRRLFDGNGDGTSIQHHLDAIEFSAAEDWVHAIKHFEQSLTGVPRRAATVAAHAHRGMATALAELGEREQAHRSAYTALELLRDWPSPDRDLSVQLVRSLGGRPPRSRQQSKLSDRELEVAALVACGMSNKQIGASLYISPRTAGVHIQNIIRKLDLGTRAEIAAHIARDQGNAARQVS